MWKLKNTETSELLECPTKPKWEHGIWDCGAFRITDVTGIYEVIVPEIEALKVSPVEFKMLFTGPERVAIKASTDPIVQDFFELVENQRIVNAADATRGLIDFGLQSTRDALDYMASKSLIAPGRIAEILTGVVK